MPWGRLDDGLYDHPKLDALGKDRLACVGLWTVSISWCNRRLTDGVLSEERVRLLGGTRAMAEHLVSAGMFDRHDDGYAIHDFLTFNDSAEAVNQRRQAAADRQRRRRAVTPMSQRESQRDEGVTHSVTGADGHSDVTRESQHSRAGAQPHDRARPGPARPVPEYEEKGSTRPSSSRGARGEGRVDPVDQSDSLELVGIEL